MFMQHRHTAWTCSVNTQHRHAAWTSRWTSSMDVQHGDMDMRHISLKKNSHFSVLFIPVSVHVRVNVRVRVHVRVHVHVHIVSMSMAESRTFQQCLKIRIYINFPIQLTQVDRLQTVSLAQECRTRRSIKNTSDCRPNQDARQLKITSSLFSLQSLFSGAAKRGLKGSRQWQ